jgi:hypothetical protein
MDDSFDAVLEQRHIKVDQQPQPFAGQLEVSQKLRVEDRGHRFDALEFDKHAVFNHEVDAKFGFEAHAFVDHW